MAKKITFLLVIMSVLLLASLTAFAGNTESAAPETGDFTKDKAESSSNISVSDLEVKYSSIFFDDASKSDKILFDMSCSRELDAESELRHNITGSVVGSTSSPAIILMYIKKDGVYVPLNSVETGTHFSEGTLITCSKVDLAYLGSDTVNDVRIIVFKKSDINNLELNKNIQITDLKVKVKRWNWIEKVIIKLNL